MSIEEYLDDIKSIQSEFLEFIEDDENTEEKFQNLCLLLEYKKIRDNKHDMRLFLHHIASVCTNHHRGKNFFSKIERVLLIFKDDIKKYCINSEIFGIFKKDKRILLFLIEEKMLIFDKCIVRKIVGEKYFKKKYPQYFAPEIKPFTKENWFPKYIPKSKTYINKMIKEIKKRLPANFYKLRKIGENESYICELIRDDNAKDFVVHMNQNNISPKVQIELSIYETNSFLIKKKNESNNKNRITLIEYAAFFGSIQIIKYLQMQGIEMTPSLWLYAIHSKNAELIHFLEDSHIEPIAEESETFFSLIGEKSYKECFGESIKCNHNEIANYFLNNYLPNGDNISKYAFNQSLKYYNFGFIQKENVNASSFFQLCANDYYSCVESVLINCDVNINNRIIQKHIFQRNSFKHNFIKQHYI